MSMSGSKIREQVAHFLVDIHNHTKSKYRKQTMENILLKGMLEKESGRLFHIFQSKESRNHSRAGQETGVDAPGCRLARQGELTEIAHGIMKGL